MSLFAPKCVRCGKRTSFSYDGRPTCESCRDILQLKLSVTREGQRVCPVDGTVMSKSIAHMIVIDRCPMCRGVWLDGGELDHLNDHIARDAMVAVARGFV
jgi:Transcription factor zinc-finger